MNLSIRQKLLATFTVNLGLLLALGIFAGYQMGRMDEGASSVTSRTLPSLGNVEDIHLALADYRRLQLEFIVNTNPADKDRTEREMRRLETEVARRLEAQQFYMVSDAERRALDRTTKAWEAFVEANHSTFLPATRRSNTGTVQPAFTRLGPYYARLEESADAMAELSELRAQAAIEAVQSTYADSQLFILAVTLLSLGISAAVGLALAATMAQRIRRLTSATIAVARGDLRQGVELGGGDELETLGQNFNHMLARLRKKQHALDKRHQDLQESLEKQRQLTEDLIQGKAAEEAAHRAKASAEAASEAKSFFLATMSHELRTPLNAILGFAQILQLEAQMRKDPVPPELERILLAGKHLLSLISNVLDFSKIEQGQMEVSLVEVPVRTLAEEVMGIIEPLAQQNDNRLTLHCPADAGSLVCDPGKLRQVLFNLLSNAVKFTEQGAIDLRVERRDSEILFHVADTGIGISPGDLESLFEPFVQLESSTTRRFDGTGLGLVVSQQLCQLMDGGISVESTLGSGSTFTIRLPLSLEVREMNIPLPSMSKSPTGGLVVSGVDSR